MIDDPEPLLTPSDAREAMRAVIRDVTLQTRNGLPVPSWTRRVLSFLAVIADASVDGSDIGTDLETVGVRDRLHMVSINEAAADVQRSTSYVRRLARQGRVRADQINGKAWVIDLDSLRSVIDKAA